jgi:hypothetical protein
MSAKPEYVTPNQMVSGTKLIYVPPGSRFKIECLQDFHISQVDEEGEIIGIKHSKNGMLKAFSKGLLQVDVPENIPWCIDYKDDESIYHPASPDKIEVPVDDYNEENAFIAKVQRMIQEAVQNQFGNNHPQIGLLEESLGFDIDEDGLIGSGEEPTMLEEFVEPANLEEAVPAETPPKAETPPETDPSKNGAGEPPPQA